jgi:Transglutaminase-like superfamily
LSFPFISPQNFANYGTARDGSSQIATPDFVRGRGRFAFLLGAALAVAFSIAGGLSARALTLAELRADAKLTPERLIKQFADFKFELSRTVRRPEIFLAAQSGDCDDFATLAADLLREKGYTTRLVVVYMPQAVHVVCYVQDSNCYLDYNCRKKAAPLVKCDGQLSAIATSVAESFHSQWRTVSEFAPLPDGTRQFLSTEFR